MTPIHHITAGAAAADPGAAKTQALKHAASEFEGVFLRALLKPMEKATAGRTGSHYGSMVVNALSEAISNAGGLGLSGVIEKSLSQKMGASSSENSHGPAPAVPRPPPTPATNPLK